MVGLISFSITTSVVITRHTSNSSSLGIQAYPAITLFTAQPLLANLCFDFWPEYRTTSFSYLKLRLFGSSRWYGSRTESTYILLLLPNHWICTCLRPSFHTNVVILALLVSLFFPPAAAMSIVGTKSFSGKIS